MKDPEKLHEVFGETVELKTPSGFKVVLRQQNGDDDDIISNSMAAQDGSSINKFVASIVVDSDISITGRISLDDVLGMKLSDKYFILIASRIFSLGQMLNFSYNWPNTPEPQEYIEDLSKYIWDYSKEYFPYEPSHVEYFKYRIKPHKFGKDETRQITTRSGKVLSYTFMNGRGERYLLKLSPESQSKNKELIARELMILLGDKWTKVENFKNFTPSDMADIRKDINENDPVTDLMTELENPVTGEKTLYLIVGTQDFFFPREV